MKRSIALVLLAGLVASACGGAGLPGLGGGGPKIGMVTDIGQLEDKSFNEFSWQGVQDGATAVGGQAEVIVTEDTADYAANIQTFVDQDYDVIVTVGFLIGSDTLKAAQENPDVQFFGIDQFVADPAPANYQGLLFAENQAGYLAGIVAANITKTNKIGAVGGVSSVPPVVAYIKGYEAAAKAENPNIEVLVNYTESFTEPDKGEASARTMIGQGADVIFQVAGLTGAGALRAACNANVWGIGVDVDQYLSLTDAQGCIVTSAEKKLQVAAADALRRWNDSGMQTGNFFNDANNDGIGVSPIRNIDMPAGLQEKLDKALADMKAGTLNPPSK
ncbi:MAG: BMP family ABC transporter substrate-binding protein [Candidatus Limnocylindria bacterium]